MFRIAARTLAEQTSDADLASGCLYPPLADIRAVSLTMATAVATFAWENDLATAPRPADIDAHMGSLVYEPNYVSYV
jgi:malate dehydrogenase (oxaloacetate-decarboxylating)(NADP+)